MEYKHAEELFARGNYSEAFRIFYIISSDVTKLIEERSEAMNMLGVLIAYEPELSTKENEFEESLDYFKESIKLNPYNIGALLNIAENYGNSFSQHKDLGLFRIVYDRLIERKNYLSENQLEMLRKKYALYSA